VRGVAANENATAKRELLDAALEAEERALGEAEAAVLAAIRTGDTRRRIKPPGLFLRMTAASDERAGRAQGGGV
jgi:hypothetical protein